MLFKLDFVSVPPYNFQKTILSPDPLDLVNEKLDPITLSTQSRTNLPTFHTKKTKKLTNYYMCMLCASRKFL